MAKPPQRADWGTLDRFIWTVGLRLVRSRKRTFLSIINLISIVGIILAVAVLSVVLSVTGGFQEEFEQRILSVQPHFLVRKYGNFTEYRKIMAQLRDAPRVIGVTPATLDEMMVTHRIKGKGQLRAGVLLKGIELSSYKQVVRVDKAMVKGKVADLRTRDGVPGIILGIELAKVLKAGIGARLEVLSPLRGLGSDSLAPFGMKPTAATFRVVGVLSNGFYEHDLRLAVVSFKAAQRFMNRGDMARWLEVRVDDMYDVEAIGQDLKDYIEPYPLSQFLAKVWDFKNDVTRIAKGDIRQALLTRAVDPVDYLRQLVKVAKITGYRSDFGLDRKETYQVLDWKTLNKNFFSSLAMQRVLFTLFFLIIIFVAAFNVVGTQMMFIKEKTPEIAILMSMGATDLDIKRIFLIQGMIVGVVGTTIGLFLGVGVCELIAAWKYPLDPMVYYISSLPIRMRLLEFGFAGAATLICVFVATLYAAGKAADKTPVQGLRFR